MNTQLPAAFKLQIPERLQLVEDLWDSIAANPEAVPVYEWQKEELKRRKQNFLKNPKSGSSWEDVKRRIRKQNA